MKVETMLNFALLDRLINKDQSFLLYKEPHSHHPSLAVFSASSIEYVYHIHELNGKSGYVFAPFEANEEHPIILLKEVAFFSGERAINAYLKTIETEVAIEEICFTQTVVPVAVSTLARQNYELAFEACHNAVVGGECQKVVLSRKHSIERPSGFSPARLFQAACSTYDEAYVYLFHTPKSGTWLGSTPEDLLMGNGTSYETVALAGTQPSKFNTEAMWDTKNCLEQQIVSDYIERTLEELGLNAEKQGPYSSKAGQLVHLKTTFQFEMPTNMEIGLGTLIDCLHPTPATCGFPKENAMQLIRQHECHDRSYYCGFVGSLREGKTTRLYVNVRCMCIKPTSLMLYAGGGIMADSSCDSEWEETESKLQTLLSLLT